MPQLEQTENLHAGVSAPPALLTSERRIDAPVSAALIRADYLALAAVLGLVLLLYAQLWLPGLVLIKRDAFQLFLPLKQYIIDRLSHGELPQWFPYEGLGRPLIAATVMGLFHPFTALYWLLPVQDAYRLSTLLCCLLAATGTFLLARRLGISRTGAAIGAIGFSCSGYVMSLTENVLYLYSICSAPLFLVALDASYASGRPAWLALAALVWAGVILNGDIQTAYYLGFVAALWTVMRTSGIRRMAVVRFAWIVALTVLIAAIQLAPAWVAYQQSDRTDASSFHAEAIHWSTHPLRLLTVLLAPVGDSSTGDEITQALFHRQEQSRGPAGFWAESLYMGPMLVGLAVAAVWRRKDLRVFSLLAGFSLMLAMGSYGGLYDICYRALPLWSAFRYPEKFMGFAALAVAMLAAGGVDAFRQGARDAVLWCVMGVLFAALGAGLTMEAAARILSGLVPLNLAPHITQSISRAAWWAAGGAIATGGLLTCVTRRPAECSWAGAALVLILALDLARANLPAIQTSTAEIWTFTPGLATALASDAKVTGPGHFRILSMKDSAAHFSETVERQLTARERVAALRRQGLYLEHNAASRIESIQHYLAGLSPRVDQIGRQGSARLAGRYNVAYFIGRPARFQSGEFAGSVVATVPDYDLALARNPSPVTPRVYVARRPQGLSPMAAVAELVEQEEFLNGAIDGIESAGPLPAGVADSHATILDYRPEAVRVAVDTSRAAVLVLNDAFEPGWTARIDGGESLEILRANGLVRAVVVPPGRAQIVFQYETPGLYLGALFSGIGLLILIALFFLSGNQHSVSNRSFLYPS